jgi:hypothetical protein
MKNLSELPVEHQKVILEHVQSAKEYITKLKGIEVVYDGYVMSFAETNLCFQPNGDGGWDVTGGTHLVPMSYAAAKSNCRRVTNGHGQSPVPVKHVDYITREIKLQEESIETFTNHFNLHA